MTLCNFETSIASLDAPELNLKKSLKYFAAKLWNDIPTDIKNSPSVNTFKSAMTEWLLTREYASQ